MIHAKTTKVQFEVSNCATVRTGNGLKKKVLKQHQCLIYCDKVYFIIDIIFLDETIYSSKYDLNKIFHNDLGKFSHN